MSPSSSPDPARATMLVGSIPGSDTRAAVDLALSELGSTLLCLPDGETGPRGQWVASIIDRLRDHPAVELKRDGDWTDYDDRPRYRALAREYGCLARRELVTLLSAEPWVGGHKLSSVAIILSLLPARM